jgi:hypothetical protein
MDEQQSTCLRACCQDCSQQQLTFVSGQGALVAEGSMRRAVLEPRLADRYRARVDSGLSSQCCPHHRILTHKRPTHELSTVMATACTYLWYLSKRIVSAKLRRQRTIEHTSPDSSSSSIQCGTVASASAYKVLSTSL